MTFERILRDGHDRLIRVRLDLVEGKKLEREIVRLANKALDRPSRTATAGGGVLRLTILTETKP